MEDTAENRLKNTLFIVEATSYEQHDLWDKWADKQNKNWEQVNPGWLVQVGKLGKRPCCINTSWVKINGQLVMFYYQCSQVTDSLQAEKWLNKHFKGKWDNGTRTAHTDAMNFHHCIDAIDEANKEKQNA
jgi:hypothetical protein